MAAKKKTTSRVSSAFSAKDRPAPAEAKKAAAKATATGLGLNKDGSPKQDERGRPEAEHGLKRTSILADKEQMQRLKLQAVKEGRHMYELFSDAIEAYLKGK